ncbi:hypothetical protein D1872_219930 [compost metagenome]
MLFQTSEESAVAPPLLEEKIPSITLPFAIRTSPAVLSTACFTLSASFSAPLYTWLKVVSTKPATLKRLLEALYIA